jgi:hypothetical protein
MKHGISDHTNLSNRFLPTEGADRKLLTLQQALFRGNHPHVVSENKINKKLSHDYLIYDS